MNEEANLSTGVNWGKWVLIAVMALVAIGVFQRRSGPGANAHRGEIVQDFTLPDVHGQKVTLSQYVAGQPFVISFGTTSCPYCEMQTKAFKELKGQFGDRVAILEVNVGESRDEVAAHVARTQRPFTTLVDEEGSVSSRYVTDAVPVTVVADAAGRIVEIGNYIPADQLEELLKLKKQSP